MNYSLMLKQLQLGYLTITMRDVKEEDQCIYCWNNKCNCGHNHNIKEDSFINFTGEELQYV